MFRRAGVGNILSDRGIVLLHYQKSLSICLERPPALSFIGPVLIAVLCKIRSAYIHPSNCVKQYDIMHNLIISRLISLWLTVKYENESEIL